VPLERYEFDRSYIERLIAKDQETERHFTRYFGDLLTLKLRRRLRSAAQVDDVKQETFVRVLATLGQKGGISSPEALGAFVNAVCNNVLLELYRSGAKVAPMDEDYDGPDERRTGPESTLLATEERSQVQRVLAELPPKDQELLRMLFFEERDKDAICQALNVDRNYLRVLLHRAKAHFRERWIADTYDA
jgi:RNA polymerase sigma-70 factor, ECF subfamily